MTEGYAIQGNPFGPGAMDFDMIAGRLDDLRYRGDVASLPGLALGVAGEWPARRGFNDIWSELGSAFDRGATQARRVAKTLQTTGTSYSRAETSAGRHVLDVVATAQQAGGPGPSLSLPEEDDFGYGQGPSMWEGIGETFREPYFQGLAGGIAGLGLRGLTGVAEMAYDDERMMRLAFIEDLERQHVELSGANPLRTRLSTWSKATEEHLALGRKMSWTVVAGALAWAAVVVESGEPLDRAVEDLRRIAFELGEAFGHDTDAVRRAVTAFWEGEASRGADAQMVTFIDEGNRLTIEVGKMARAIAESVHALEVIHWAALSFSAAMFLAIAALRVAGRFDITIDWVTKFMGWRWSTLITMLAGLAPTVAAFGVAWYKSSSIGDPREIWPDVVPERTEMSP
ncbi:hypothetical protein [Nonomuraea phyllanthi]|nr:hypothetical protein [Nonomuraea phyllanthi]